VICNIYSYIYINLYMKRIELFCKSRMINDIKSLIKPALYQSLNR